ncbi:YozE family protein, partial [Staphylococcus haemolyticus]|uniref:YozE family protein n=1 Tax=Staphylococcus haemolyticus TaxID=1283 RepID=UPI0011A1011D
QPFIPHQTPLGQLPHSSTQHQHFPKYQPISHNILTYFTKITTFHHQFLQILKPSISLYQQTQL